MGWLLVSASIALVSLLLKPAVSCDSIWLRHRSQNGSKPQQGPDEAQDGLRLALSRLVHFVVLTRESSFLQGAALLLRTQPRAQLTGRFEKPRAASERL